MVLARGAALGNTSGGSTGSGSSAKEIVDRVEYQIGGSGPVFDGYLVRDPISGDTDIHAVSDIDLDNPLATAVEVPFGKDGTLVDPNSAFPTALPATEPGDFFKAPTTATIGGVLFTQHEIWKNTSGVSQIQGSSPAIAGAYTKIAEEQTTAIDSIGNTHLTNMPAYSFKMRNAGTTGDPQDVALGGLTVEANPQSGDFVMMFLATGETVVADASHFLGGGGGGDLLAANNLSDLDNIPTARTNMGLGALAVLSTINATALIDNDVVTFDKLQNVATSIIVGRIDGGSGNAQELTPGQVRALLNVSDGANAYVHPNHSGDVTSVADGATTLIHDQESEADKSGAETITWVAGRKKAKAFSITATTNITLSAPEPGDYLLTVTQGGAGGFDITFVTSVSTAYADQPITQAAAGAKTLIPLRYDGTTWFFK